MTRQSRYKAPGVTPQQLRSWINRQRTLDRPSPLYIEWLRQQFRITCQAEVKNENSNTSNRISG